jgi:hypothetical protein
MTASSERSLKAHEATYRATPRILREATAATLPADLEASLKAFLRARTTAFDPPESSSTTPARGPRPSLHTHRP